MWCWKLAMCTAGLSASLCRNQPNHFASRRGELGGLHDPDHFIAKVLALRHFDAHDVPQHLTLRCLAKESHHLHQDRLVIRRCAPSPGVEGAVANGVRGEMFFDRADVPIVVSEPRRAEVRVSKNFWVAGLPRSSWRRGPRANL